MSSTHLTHRFEEALAYASRLHNNQRRKGSDVPYISHLLAVCSLVLENGGTEDEAIAALLHDAIEDQGGDAARQEIQKLYGDAVVEIVNGCSDTDQTPKPPWRERKEAYLAHLPLASPSSRLVSLADKVHNARTTLIDYQIQGDDLWKRFKGGKEGTLWYYRAVLNTFKSIEITPLVLELERVVVEMEKITAAH